MKLIIVESPHKSTTITHFLSSDYKVMASKGHICDLASTGKMGLGVDIEDNFKPNYVISSDKKGIVAALKKAVSQADEVYLATDPDREGEAISYHLARILNLPIETTKRLEFHEVTKKAIQNSLQNPRVIDMNLVESQEARRIIDRLMGYRLSFLLQKKIKSKSAGRVQSVVLKLIVDKEKEIKAFVPTEYWSIDGIFSTNKLKTSADLVSYKNETIKINNEEEVDKIIASLPEKFTVKDIKHETKKRDPKPPFITSTLQQEAFSQFHYSPTKTSSIAQKLYEGKDIGGNVTGLITYMRTDSIRLADEFISSCSNYIASEYGENYLGKVKTQKANKNVQDAHEAIRPTDISLTPSKIKKYLSKEEFQLYSLIFDRAVASLMQSRKDEIITLVLTGNDYDFTTSETNTLFDGFYKVYGKYEEKEEKKVIPSFKIGDELSKDKINKVQHFTKPPFRYNEGKVVKLMQDNGIGRPSTYATTLYNLLSHDYLENQKGSLIPTEQGELTIDKLIEFFPDYMNVKYTSTLETKLDDIALGKEDEHVLLSKFWEVFKKQFDVAYEKMGKIQTEEVGRNCPVCGKPLVYRAGKYGKFVGCSNYPTCTFIEKESKKVEILEGKKCPKCGGDLIKRKSKKGVFYGCSNFPKCNYMEDLQGKEISLEKKEVVIPSDAPICPKCGKGHLIEKKSRYGKTFTACSNYPECKYIVSDKNKEKEEK